jgi:hypothetical protein
VAGGLRWLGHGVRGVGLGNLGFWGRAGVGVVVVVSCRVVIMWG